MKKGFILLLAIALLFAMFASGCSQQTTEPTEVQTTDEQELKDRISELESQIAEMTAAASSAAAARYVLGVNALMSLEDTASPQSELIFTGPTSVKAIAVVPEGMALDYWCVNGIPIDGQEEEITVDVEGNTVIEAVLREELKVTTINAYIQLLNADGEPEGDKLTDYIFEEMPEKKVSIYVCAEVPDNYEIDYWIINGAPYYFNKTVTNFKVVDLSETTVFEVVLKEAAAPVARVSISCINCTFSGGGYTNATSGSVPKGTSITVTGSTDIGNPQYWIINGSNKDYGKTFTYTVNVNTTFQYTGWN